MKIYTKRGDGGQSSLVDGSKVTKDHLRLQTYGTLDELNSHVGLLISFLLEPLNPGGGKKSDKTGFVGNKQGEENRGSNPCLFVSEGLFSKDVGFLKQVQIWLFHLGSQLACDDIETSKRLPTLTGKQIVAIESCIDDLEKSLPELKNFILPGGHHAASQAHICRTVTRRAERYCVTLSEKIKLEYPALSFLNRLSDYFFVLARSVNHRLGVKSTQWVP